MALNTIAEVAPITPKKGLYMGCSCSAIFVGLFPHLVFFLSLADLFFWTRGVIKHKSGLGQFVEGMLRRVI